ncbi:serine hydrolase [Pseudoalteromonas sp. BMB]|uniref:serine hydrolase domain-containing protein n=1 Tax=Pseudoalteromonas sp. BMB TaxID=1874619 RepID=UPI00083E2D52|nr:serine hydrolase domain-containing protein [Pseudoalteromonas sp. BMB]ODB38591.1 serine hydrolase [Pseudoalteromonas sp. BMB]
MRVMKITLVAALVTVASCAEQKLEAVAPDYVNKQRVFEQSIREINDSGVSSETASTLQSRMSTYRVPAVSITVFDNNHILWSKGYGVTDEYSKVNVTPDTLFQAASISKAVTSFGAFKMIELGRFGLHEDVNSKLTRWQIPNNKFTKENKVTPSRIMSHTSGLNVQGFAGYGRNQKTPSLVQVLQGSELSNSPSVRVFQTPGKSEFYSGGGMTVLQLLMEDSSELSFSELMEKQVLKPLSMNNSSFKLASLNLPQYRVAKGHDLQANMIAGGYRLYPEKAAAGLWSTPSDLALFMIALGKSYRGDEESLLSPHFAKVMLTRVPGAGGTGIGLDGEGNAFRFRHSGGNAGYTCYAVSFASVGRGFVVMTNSDNGFQLIHEISRAISEIYDWPALWMHE